MGILYWILLGLVVGALAKLLVPGKGPGGIIVTIIIGVLGALLGGWIGTKLGLGSVQGFDLTSILLATGGSVLLILLYNLIKKK